jgi:hypothetical protein
MANIKKAYNYSRGRQIWRLIPDNNNKLIIEERDTSSKEVFFNCLDINSGKKIFHDFQLDEKYWVGIETVFNDIIIFHKYASRDMPEHDEIIAFDINSNKILWQNNNYIFLFICNDKIYCYRNKFEGRDFFSLDYKNGSLLESLGDDSKPVNSLRENAFNPVNGGGYLFPESYNSKLTKDSYAGEYFEQLTTNNKIAGKIEYIETEGMIFFNCHHEGSGGNLKNIFKAIEISSKKIILEETLNFSTNVFIPDCFFIKDRLLFLLIEKVKLKVCAIKI